MELRRNPGTHRIGARGTFGVGALALLASALALPAAAQPQTLLFEDFETGAPGWTHQDIFNSEWHLAAGGECGTPTATAAYNLGSPNCRYEFSLGIFDSPTFVLTGQPPFTVTLDYRLQLDATPSFGDVVEISLLEPSTGLGTSVATQQAMDTSGTLIVQQTFPVPNGAAWAGKTMQIELIACMDQFGNQSLGWYVDNLSVRNAGPPCPGAFTGYGSGLAGSLGITPQITGSGCPAPGVSIGIELAQGLGGAPGILLLGLTQASIPAFGGTLLLVPLGVSIPFSYSGPGGIPGAGLASVPLAIPPNPALVGTVFDFQALDLDPGAPAGVAMTAGLAMTVQ